MRPLSIVRPSAGGYGGGVLPPAVTVFVSPCIL